MTETELEQLMYNHNYAIMNMPVGPERLALIDKYNKQATEYLNTLTEDEQYTLYKKLTDKAHESGKKAKKSVNKEYFDEYFKSLSDLTLIAMNLPVVTYKKFDALIQAKMESEPGANE